MKTYLIVFSLLYLSLMVFFFVKYMLNRQNVSSSNEFLFANSSIGIIFTFLGILATLFSTFTLQGMPAFFKNHGIGSWLFLGVIDVCLAGFLLYFGLRFRKFAASLAKSPKNIIELFKSTHTKKSITFFYLFFTTVFIIPYVTIQIKGASVLFNAAMPMGETHLFWSCVMVLLMLLYSSSGGIRAIYTTDAIQGVLILIATWAVAFYAIKGAGGVENIFLQAAQHNQDLMSVPGPKGVLNWQFFLISFISICLMPYVQPQLATRVLVAKDDKTFVKATLFFGIFVIFVILPTVFIGLRGVVYEGDFLVQVLQNDVPSAFYALFVVGVVAAAMSTTDSQLMAIGTEWGSFFSKTSIKENQRAKLYVKLSAAMVALVSLILAQTSFKSLILFSINSFIGTSLLLPIIYSLTIKENLRKNTLLGISVFSVGVFIFSLVGIIPKMIFEMRVELYLYAIMALVFSFFELNSSKKVQKVQKSAIF